METKKNNLWKKISSIATTVLVALIVLAAVLLMGARVIGLRVFTVVSGSMKPTYLPGDLIYVKEVSPETIEVGDPITFVLNEDLVVATHRVVEIDTEKQRFYTKGDNNQIADTEPVHYKNLIGKPIFRIPYLGYVSTWVQSPPGLYIVIGVGIVLVALVFLPDLFRGNKKKKEENEPAPEKNPEDKGTEE